jgi:hypothetical protein
MYAARAVTATSTPATTTVGNQMKKMMTIIIINIKPRVGYANVCKYVGKILRLQFALQY